MSHQSEVHIGDRGTQYQYWFTDADGVFDPSDAVVKQLIFHFHPFVEGQELTKDAVVLTDGSPATRWGLGYTIVAGDGIGSPAGEFHAAAGRFRLQPYLEYTDGTRWHGSVRDTDDDGHELRVHRNLREMNESNEFES